MKKLFYLSIICFAIVSCRKQKTYSELILGDWRMSALTVDPPQVVNSVVITDLYAQMEDCDKDNYVSFFDNGTYRFDEGATKCEMQDPQTKSGNWEFLENDTKLRVIQLNDTLVYTMIDLKEELLKMSYSGRDSNNILHTLTVTFGKL